MSSLNYYGRLFPVEIGQFISIVGKACNNPESFSIDLTAANGQENDDIHLNISVRFGGDEPVVVRNTKAAGQWGEEEGTDNLFPHNSLNPFKPGGDFKVDIFVDEVAYFISIDNKPFCTYSHRMPVDGIQVINITGDVEAIYQVNQRNAQPRPWPAVNVNEFESIAPGQFDPGNIIVITGVPRGDANGDFTVNLFDGSNRFRTHFQFQAVLENQEIFLDSQDDKGNWRGEVTGNYPFNICETFKLAIALTNDEFQVAINGQKVATLAYVEEHERLFGSLTGIVLNSNNGLNVQVQSVAYMRLPADCEGFENFTHV